MKTRSSSEAATAYERFVQRFFAELAVEDRLQVFHQREYEGKISGRRIKIDVSFEVAVFGARILFLVECKHFKRRVQAGHVDEFQAKLTDIRAHKGIVATTVGFQDGAVKTAHGHGIGLLLLTPRIRRGGARWLVNTRTAANAKEALPTDCLVQGYFEDPLLTRDEPERFDNAAGLWSVLFSGLASYVSDDGKFGD